MAYETIETERVHDGDIAVVRLARPDEHNVIDSTVLAELAEAFRAADRAAAVDGLVLSSTEPPFCTGASLSELRDLDFEAGARWMAGYFDTLEVLRTTGKPVVAAVEGTCVAGGNELAMAADLVIAGESTRLGQPEVGVGSTAGGGGVQLLPLLVGEKRARELLLTGDLLEAETARDWGLINRVVADGAAEAAAVELVAEIIETKSPQAYRTIKAMLEPWTNLGLANRAMARDTTARVWASEEFRERADAFLDREDQAPRSFAGTLREE